MICLLVEVQLFWLVSGRFVFHRQRFAGRHALSFLLVVSSYLHISSPPSLGHVRVCLRVCCPRFLVALGPEDLQTRRCLQPTAAHVTYSEERQFRNCSRWLPLATLL